MIRPLSIISWTLNPNATQFLLSTAQGKLMNVIRNFCIVMRVINVPIIVQAKTRKDKPEPGATYYMVFGKTRTFLFLEIGILWSSLRIKFSNLRFEDFHFCPNIRKHSTNKKVFGRKFFCSAEDFFVRTNIFFLRQTN